MTSKLPDFPPPVLPPKYAPTFGMDDPFSSANKLHSNYLRHLNLVLGFEPPRVYLMMETILTRVTQAWDEAAKGQPMTPCVMIHAMYRGSDISLVTYPVP